MTLIIRQQTLQKYIRIFTLFMITVYPSLKSQIQAEELSGLILKGKNGGLADGSEWASDKLKNKINILFYVVPDKQSWVKQLVVRLDSIQYKPELVALTFIINTSATIIPDFILINRVKKKAEENKQISYVLDRNKILVKEWNLFDNDVNVLLLGQSGKVIQKYNGRISAEKADQFIKMVDYLINKGEEQ